MEKPPLNFGGAKRAQFFVSRPYLGDNAVKIVCISTNFGARSARENRSHWMRRWGATVPDRHGGCYQVCTPPHTGLLPPPVARCASWGFIGTSPLQTQCFYPPVNPRKPPPNRIRPTATTLSRRDSAAGRLAAVWSKCVACGME